MKWFTLIFSLFCVTCDVYKDQPELKIARDFVDAYYVFADQQKALKLSMGRAARLLNDEMALLKTLETSADAYRSRTILFTLKKQESLKNEVIFLFELDIKVPQLLGHKLLVTVSVDRREFKVKDFRTLESQGTF